MDVAKNTIFSSLTFLEEGGLMNLMLSFSVFVYRHLILAFDVMVFLLKERQTEITKY